MKAGDILIIHGRSYEIQKVSKQERLDDVYWTPNKFRLHIKPRPREDA